MSGTTADSARGDTWLEVLKSRTRILPSMACWSCKAEARARRTLGESSTILVECTHEQKQEPSPPTVETKSILPPIKEEELPRQAPLSEERKRAIVGVDKKEIPPERKLKPLCLGCGKPHGRSWAASYCNKDCRLLAIKNGTHHKRRMVQL